MRFGIYGKDEIFTITNNLVSSEFKCGCKNDLCTFTIIDSEFVRSWNLLRSLWAEPIHLNSGYRCINHNANVGGRKKSRHCKGSAGDLSTMRMDERTLMEFISLCSHCFDVVIPYNISEKILFVHCHNV